MVDNNRALFDRAKAHFGHVDVAVNTAGAVIKKAIADVTEADYDRSFDANAKAAFFFIQQAGRTLENGGGIVTLVSSLLAAYTPYYAIYPASKAAVNRRAATAPSKEKAAPAPAKKAPAATKKAAPAKKPAAKVAARSPARKAPAKSPARKSAAPRGARGSASSTLQTVVVNKPSARAAAKAAAAQPMGKAPAKTPAKKAPARAAPKAAAKPPARKTAPRTSR